MAEQSKGITTGELNATIEEYGEFKTQEVEFTGSEDDSGCLLQGVDSEIGFVFYLPTCESREYSLYPGSDAKAFFGVGGRQHWEVEKGSIKVTVDKRDKLSIAFDIFMKESDGGNSKRITGNGTFNGRTPWSDKRRELLSVLQGVAPLWLEGPDINEPKPGTVQPGFRIVGQTGIANPDDWELQIYIGSEMVLQNTGQSGRIFSYDVSPSLIPRGTVFYFKLDYYIFPFWSKWTFSGDLMMAVLDSPVILKPVDNEFVTTDKPEVSGTGIVGAKIVVKAVHESRVVGTAIVGDDGNWKAPTLIPLPYFPYAIFSSQYHLGSGSGMSNIVTINRHIAELKKPVILRPAQNDVVRRTEVEISGANGSPGAKVHLYRSGSGTVDHGTALVGEDGTWTIKGQKLYLGWYTLTVQQSLEGRVSEFSDDLKIFLVL